MAIKDHIKDKDREKPTSLLSSASVSEDEPPPPLEEVGQLEFVWHRLRLPPVHEEDRLPFPTTFSVFNFIFVLPGGYTNIYTYKVDT